MKVRHSQYEKGQGGCEYVIGLVIIILLCLGAVWLITKLVVMIKDNVTDMNPPTATLQAPSTAETTLVPPTSPITSTPNIIPQETDETPTPIMIEPPIPTVPAETPDGPSVGLWQQFLNWLKSFNK